MSPNVYRFACWSWLLGGLGLMAFGVGMVIRSFSRPEDIANRREHRILGLVMIVLGLALAGSWVFSVWLYVQMFRD